METDVDPTQLIPDPLAVEMVAPEGWIVNPCWIASAWAIMDFVAPVSGRAETLNEWPLSV